MSAAKDRWRTPKPLIQGIERLLNLQFNLDVACDDKNAVCDRFISEDLDALQCDWGGIDTKAFVNPPYANCKNWVNKCIEQRMQNGVTSVMLVPNSTDTQWYMTAREHNALCILIVGSRIQFDPPILYDGEDAKKKSSNTGGSMLLVFAPEGAYDFIPQRNFEVHYDHLLCLGT